MTTDRRARVKKVAPHPALISEKLWRVEFHEPPGAAIDARTLGVTYYRTHDEAMEVAIAWADYGRGPFWRSM